jgi:hypothetical protein
MAAGTREEARVADASNELGCRRTEKQAEYLGSELEQRSAKEESGAVRGVVSDLCVQLSDIEDELAEYVNIWISTAGSGSCGG